MGDSRRVKRDGADLCFEASELIAKLSSERPEVDRERIEQFAGNFLAQRGFRHGDIRHLLKGWRGLWSCPDCGELVSKGSGCDPGDGLGHPCFDYAIPHPHHKVGVADG